MAVLVAVVLALIALAAIARVKAVSATNVLAITVPETNVSVQIVLEINAPVNIQQTRQTQLMKG